MAMTFGDVVVDAHNDLVATDLEAAVSVPVPPMGHVPGQTESPSRLC